MDESTIDPATAYARAVASKDIIAGPYVRATCQRHLDDLECGAERGLYFDPVAVQNVQNFFRTVLTIETEEKQDDGSVESKVAPFILQPWQVFIVGSLFGWKNADGLRRFRRAYIEIGKGAGKALALDTPIPTPFGWRDMRDLQPGDAVFDERGVQCNVTAVTDVLLDRPCYRVKFSDGAEIVADADHLWQTTAMRNGGAKGPKLASAPRKGAPYLRTTSEIAATLAVNQSSSAHPQAKWNHRVDIAGALELPEAKLQIPPYTLGVWLGDGDSDSARITVAMKDWQIVQEIEAEGVPVVEQARHAPHIARISLSVGRGARHDGLPASVLSAALDQELVTVPELARVAHRDPDRVSKFVSTSGFFDQVSSRRGVGDGGGTIAAVWRLKEERISAAKTETTRGLPISLRLAALGLLNNKHIPQLYLRASRIQRLSLLQGLMDSDGHHTKGRECEFCVTNMHLAQGVLELIRSLGLKATHSESDAMLNGKTVGRRYRIRFNPGLTSVFRLKRKLERQKEPPRSRPLSTGRMIVGCEPISSVPVKCISVDSPSRMYLAGREMVPTHNSPLAAGIGHYFLGGKGIAKERGEVYSAATSRDQAFILFRDAIAMWRRSRNLTQRISTKGKQTQTISQLTHIRTDSIFKPVSTENKGQSGLRPYCALIDEVHEHADNSVIEMMRAGTKGNQEALIFEITNSGFNKNTVCGQEHDYSVQVVYGDKKNDEWFAYIAALDDGDEPFEDEACWIKANPNLGVSIHPAYIRGQVNEAKGLPSKEGTVRRLNFCQWTESENCAIPRDLWMKCEAPIDLDLLVEEGWQCFGGLDLSRVNDLSAFTLTWLPVEIKDQWRFVSKTWFWTPKDTLVARAKRDRAPYDVWAKDGFLEAVPGKILKFGWIAESLLEICSRYHPTMIGCDEYGLKQLVEKLEEMGQSLPCVVHPQGFQKRHMGDRPELEGTGVDKIELWMPDSINKLEAALLEQRISIDTNPVMRMCSQGVVYTQNRTGHRMFDKDRATMRIDGMISLAMSIGVATLESTASPAAALNRAILERAGFA